MGLVVRPVGVVQAEIPAQIPVVTRVATSAAGVKGGARVSVAGMAALEDSVCSMNDARGAKDILTVILITALVFGVVYGLNESLHLRLRSFTVYVIVVLVTLAIAWTVRRMKNKKTQA